MYKLKYHPSLTTEIWQKHPVEKQLFMVANELNRLINGLQNLPDSENTACMERILELLDLTISCQKGNLRKELLRFRELFSAQYPSSSQTLPPAKTTIAEYYKVLLTLSSKSAILLS